MSLSADLVALTLLPVWRWRFVAEGLRGGREPADLLTEQCAELTSSRRPTCARDARVLRRHNADALRSRAREAIARAGRLGVDAIAWNDAAFPRFLSTIIDPPPVLWVHGTRDAFELPMVAIVGSRNASDYALAVADRLSADLAARGVIVVSGLARGVDSAAHRAALSAGAQTIAVLGSGVDVIYPSEHTDLAAQIAANGAVISEFVPGTPPNPRFFPQRNRIISGLARAVVIVEAGEKSGSLITARCALEQGRDVFAVPGNVLSGANRGGHALLRDGAALAETADDVLRELGLAEPSASPAASKRAEANIPRSADDPVLASLVPGESSDLDVIAARSGLSPSYLLTRLLELEVHGLVRRTDGGRFVRFDRTC